MVMKSTYKNDRVSSLTAIQNGLAKDGGLYVPEEFPILDFSSFNKDNITFKNVSKYVLYNFLSDSFTEAEVERIIDGAFDFNPELININNCHYLELFHGNTAAFKDFGARFLSYTLEEILKKQNSSTTILVATSGDTGSAVESAFYKRENIKVKVLFPKGMVSERQKKLLTIWGENIESYEVSGTFDDCQKMVKDAFKDKNLNTKYNLSSANSINIGRLLPQVCYYVYSSLIYKFNHKRESIFIVPSGNMGNSTACLYAKKIGAPIKSVVLAQNANRPMVDYLLNGVYIPHKTIKTLANAMDVGDPSNKDRMFDLYPTIDEFKKDVSAYSVSDEQIIQTIKSTYKNDNYIICPHTACAKFVKENYYKNEDCIVVSTAHPGKFEKIIKSAINVDVDLPEKVALLLNRKQNYSEISTNYLELF